MGITLATEDIKPDLGVARPKPIRVEALMPDGQVIRISGYQTVQEGRFLKIITAIDEVEYLAIDVAVHVKVTGALQSLSAPATPATTTFQPGAVPPAISPQPTQYVNPVMQAIHDGTAVRVPTSARISGTDDKPVRSLITDDEGKKTVVDAGFV